MKPHRISEKHKVNDAEHKLYEAISLIKTSTEARKFFQDLCTPTEIQSMADRWIVVASIKEGKPYRKIYEETKVSVTTVGRVARCILLGEGGYNLIYDRLDKKSQVNSKKKR